MTPEYGYKEFDATTRPLVDGGTQSTLGSDHE